MCGIVGIAGQHHLEWVHRMNDIIVYRGPDDQGVYHSPDHLTSFAMRRLSILDLQGGHQPMSNEDGSVWIVFNGEIYNAPTLRSSLEQQGHRFRTANSDTEVLLHLYDEKRQDMLDDLNGMFAFVIHDQRRNLLFAARDQRGIKPLYYWWDGSRFAFASELKCLLTLPFVKREINQQSLYHYMTLLYVPGEASIIQGVRRLQPGQSLVYDVERQQLTPRWYWQLKFNAIEHHSEEEWAELLRAELRAAVGRWVLSDVPIACSLSGGVDSSAVVGLLAELGYPKIKTYSLGFEGEEEQSWNEIGLARQVAHLWGTDHHELLLNPDDLLDDLLSMVWHLDEPYGGGVPSWYVFRAMSKDVKVALTGMGGDELFGNYGTFRYYEDNFPVGVALAARRWLRGGADIVAQVLTPLGRLTRHISPGCPCFGRGRLLSKLPSLLPQPFGRYYYANFCFFSDDQKRASVLRLKNGELQDTAAYLQQLYDSIHAPDLRNGLSAVAFRTQLAEEFLLMTDRLSMAHSLEARVPFLDHHFVELVFRIPSSIRTRPGDLKYLLKRAVADLLPPDLLKAPKRGFFIPVELWLRRQLRPLAERLLSPERLAKQGIFRKEFYDQFVQPHIDGKANFTWHIWAALMYQLWHILYIEERLTSTPSFSWKDLC
jgi:asparagine synthase (glutamine-hydrolysing)